jgi:hypothetical protein
MGWSPLDPDRPKARAVIGDQPFDAISECFAEVCRLYRRDWKRKPTLAELLGTVEAVLAAQLDDHTKDGESAELIGLSFQTKKIPKRQRYSAGDVLQATLKGGDLVFARIFEIDDLIGPMVGVYDSRGMSPVDIAGIISQPLIVKICPIHPETIQFREWLVIGNARLRPTDKKRPRGPLEIHGTNNHLEMAEYYYGLRTPKRLDREEWDEWIVQQSG